ncbi:phage protein [Streptococcus pneumoniae]|nr:phage protein [Streptococcus pneumoniae]
MPRDGTKNLKPVTERTKDEARAISSKGGKASGIARRKKADLKKAFEILLSLDVTDSKIKKQLEEMGMAGNNEALLAFATFQQAVKGNQKATENIIKLTNTIYKNRKSVLKHSNMKIESVLKLRKAQVKLSR